MSKIALIYWPRKGNVEKVAGMVADGLDDLKPGVYAISQVDLTALADHDLIILGSSTVGADNWEDSHRSRWYDFFKQLENVRFKGQKIAFFGLGDQVLYPEHFVDGMMAIKKEFARHDVEFIGKWPAQGYDFQESASLEGDDFIGLAVDEDQQPELTKERVDQWVAQVRKESGL
ncbi:MAG: flavodoxin [Bacteroidales bacterium]